MNMVYYLINY